VGHVDLPQQQPGGFAKDVERFMRDARPVSMPVTAAGPGATAR
jgi:hypothetical protein